MAVEIHPQDMEVVLIATPDRVLTDVAAKFCQTPGSITSIVDSEYSAPFVQRVLGYGHTAVSEFDWFVFGVDNVSRSLTHQLVRKRIGVSYAQESQRFVDPSNDDGLPVVVPPTIAANPRAFDEYLGVVKIIEETYRDLTEGYGIPKEDARYILSQGGRTKILVGMNARSLNEFFAERCCSCAQWEIRAMANKMLALAKNAVPDLFRDAGPKCLSLGYCPEASYKWCGRSPLKNDVLAAWRNVHGEPQN